MIPLKPGLSRWRSFFNNNNELMTLRTRYGTALASITKLLNRHYFLMVLEFLLTKIN